MAKEFCYTVAGHCFSVYPAADIDLEEPLAHYAPFATDPSAAPGRVFVLNVVPKEALPEPEGLVVEFDQDDDGSQIRLSRTPDGRSWFEFRIFGTLSGTMLAESDFSSATLAFHKQEEFALNNALMVMYAMRTAAMGTALFHAAVIGHAGRGYLFLGKSGTGKSTHARLWLQYVPDSELVNDDNPVVRVFPDGTARVYGSPWSGKTPCYRNMELPLGGFVQLAQAPYNAIRRLKGISAYAALVPSISGKRWDRQMADGLHETENALAMNVPVWHLDCLPDEAAARLCAGLITEA
jgi:hypothetical protein